MALSNHERIGKALDLLAAGLKPFVGRELQTIYPDIWFKETQRTLMESLSTPTCEGKPAMSAASMRSLEAYFDGTRFLCPECRTRN